MDIYLVGGAVRDQLLGLPIKERDWVVVGATEQTMLQAGFQKVGKDFPVFLHPKTKEEYALARKEKKVGRGYIGFAFDTSVAVTLEEDLKRRDITINAIAQDATGHIIDPYHGQEDIKTGILRHVSPAFVEDPVRILRIARFAARFNFRIADETLQLMQQMVQNGEVNALVPERVWKEFEKALQEPYPEAFFKVLNTIDALTILFPEYSNNNIDLTVLKNMVILNLPTRVRLAAASHLLTVHDMNLLANRLRLPTEYRELMLLVANYKDTYKRFKSFSAEDLLIFLQNTDAFRRKTRFMDFLAASQVCTGVDAQVFFLTALDVANTYDKSVIISQTKGIEIAKIIFEARKKVIQQWLGSVDKS